MVRERQEIDIHYLADHRNLIPTLAAWYHEEWSYLHPQRTLGDFERTIGARTNRHRVPLALVAIKGEELLGTVCLKANDMETREDLTPWLAGLYVAKDQRRKGIGSALVKAVERKAAELGISTLYLYTPDAEPFYAKMGWKLRERTVYKGFPVAVMEKDIVL